MRRVLTRATRALGAMLLAAGPALGQGAPPTATFPEPTPAPAQTPTPTPTPAPAPAYQQPPPAYQQPPPAYQQPPPAYQQPPPAYQQPPPAYEQPPPAYEPPPPVYEPPPPPERPPSKSSIPTMSVRADPFNLLINGKLGIELEAELLKWMSVELVPIFVVNDQPPAFGYFTGPHGVKQRSTGLGPIAGTSVDVGFWLNGHTMEGNVVRVILTDYGYEYSAPLDKISHVERQFLVYFGSHSRWGAFTLAGGIGLGAELHKQRHCYVPVGTGANANWVGSNQCENNALFLRVDKTNVKGVEPPQIDVSSGLGGIQIMGRISLGVVF